MQILQRFHDFFNFLLMNRFKNRIKSLKCSTHTNLKPLINFNSSEHRSLEIHRTASRLVAHPIHSV